MEFYLTLSQTNLTITPAIFDTKITNQILTIYYENLVWFDLNPFGNPFAEGQRVTKVMRPGRVPKRIARERGKWRNLIRRERRQNAQLLESAFLTCCRRLVPLRFVIVFPCRLNFSAGSWAISPENLPTSRCLRKTDYVMLSSDFFSCRCNHAPLARLCSDEL